MSSQQQTPKYPRPQSVEDALQIAIEKWIAFQYRTWEQQANHSTRLINYSGVILRILIIGLAGSITAMSEIDVVPRTTVTVISAILTILTGVEGFLKLTDRKIQIENQRTEVIAEYNRQGYEWMTRVHMETDPEKALEAAKDMLKTSPEAINKIKARYLLSSAGKNQTNTPG